MRMIAQTVTLWLTAMLATFTLAQTPKTVDRLYEAIAPRLRDVVESYLRTDCEIGEVGIALKAVVRAGEAASPYLTAVQREGPPSAVLADFERGVDQTWEARQAFLKTPDALELGQESFAMMRAITREQYVKDQREAIQAKYRERAALALKALEAR